MFTSATMVASAPSRRRKVRTSASSVSLASYGRVNEFGFIETPYRHVYTTAAGHAGRVDRPHCCRTDVTDPESGKVIAEARRRLSMRSWRRRSPRRIPDGD